MTSGHVVVAVWMHLTVMAPIFHDAILAFHNQFREWIHLDVRHEFLRRFVRQSSETTDGRADLLWDATGFKTSRRERRSPEDVMEVRHRLRFPASAGGAHNLYQGKDFAIHGILAQAP